MAEDIGPSDLQRLQRAIVRANTAMLPLESDFHASHAVALYLSPYIPPAILSAVEGGPRARTKRYT